jgi:hypothetical protein
MLKVGQKVICIDVSPARNNAGPFLPLMLTHGAVYTIREIHTEPHLDGYGVRLDELVNPSIVWSDRSECEWSYQSERFRPVIDTDTETRERAEAQ